MIEWLSFFYLYAMRKFNSSHGAYLQTLKSVRGVYVLNISFVKDNPAKDEVYNCNF